MGREPEKRVPDLLYRLALSDIENYHARSFCSQINLIFAIGAVRMVRNINSYVVANIRMSLDTTVPRPVNLRNRAVTGVVSINDNVRSPPLIALRILRADELDRFASVERENLRRTRQSFNTHFRRTTS